MTEGVDAHGSSPEDGAIRTAVEGLRGQIKEGPSAGPRGRGVDVKAGQCAAIKSGGAVNVDGTYAFPRFGDLGPMETGPFAHFAPRTLWHRAAKRTVDLALASLFLPLALPVFLVVALLVRLSSTGPVFFSQRRIGRNGAVFSMWKFRTMVEHPAGVLQDYLDRNPDARSEWLANHKLQNDPRVTPIGSLLRRYSLDEIPQLWNVLRGEMSLVGPRPIVAAEVKRYGPLFSCYCMVKPGLTGLWQVSGRSRLSYPERVALDCEYVHKWSPLLDTRVLFRTFFALVSREGAF